MEQDNHVVVNEAGAKLQGGGLCVRMGSKRKRKYDKVHEEAL